MDWLKTLLEGATITDGKLDVDALMKNINTEFPKHAVPKDDYNAKAKELKAANDTIKELKDANAGNEGLQSQIEDYKKQVKTLQDEAANTAKTYALKDALAKEGVTDTDYLIYKLGDSVKYDKDNKPENLADVLKPFKEDKTMAHLFKVQGGFDPHGGGDGGTKNPFAKDTFNLTEQGKLLKENPAQARELAAAAGVTI